MTFYDLHVFRMVVNPGRLMIDLTDRNTIAMKDI